MAERLRTQAAFPKALSLAPISHERHLTVACGYVCMELTPLASGVPALITPPPTNTPKMKFQIK